MYLVAVFRWLHDMDRAASNPFMVNMDNSTPTGPHRDLTELSESTIDAQIERQCEIWDHYTLDADWYNLLLWWVTLRKDAMPAWRVRWHWSDEYWPAGGELNYKAWFEAVCQAEQILPVESLLHSALNTRKRYEGRELQGPLESANP